MRLYIQTRGCCCEGLAGMVPLGTSSSKGAGPFQDCMLCLVLPFSKGSQKEDKKRNLILQSTGSYSLCCQFPGGAKAHQVLQHSDLDLHCPLIAGLCSFSSPGRSEVAFWICMTAELSCEPSLFPKSCSDLFSSKDGPACSLGSHVQFCFQDRFSQM